MNRSTFNYRADGSRLSGFFIVAGLCLCLALHAQADRAPGDASQADFRKIINRAKEKVFPALVFIRCVREGFESGQKTSSQVAGSGVIVSGDGEVLTNWHVVEKAVEVRCLLFDGRAITAKVLGADKDTDVALLRLETPPESAPLPRAALGEARHLREGDFVMAMGAPWGLSRSVSLGIISCSRRYLPESSEYSCWLQTDAAISPGNSGGPLVNTDGEVVGINARGVLMGGDMGFAVPIEVAREVAAQLRANGKVNWSWTGLQLQPLKDFERNVYFKATEGVMVAETDPESPARHAGIQAGDRLVRLDGQPMTAMVDEDLPDIRRRIGLLPKLRPVKFELARQTQRLTVELIPREKGRVEGESLDCPRWDFTAKSINRFDNPDLYLQRAKGVFVFGVKSLGNASKAGLRSRDILVKIDEQEVQTLEELKTMHRAALEKATQRPRVVVTVLRDGLMRQVALDFSTRYDE